MTKFLGWWLLWRLLGNPFLALFVLVAVFFVFDRLAFGLLPPFLRAWLRFGRVGRLRRAIAANPHDRPARWELAQILIERRRHQEAARVIAPNLEAGDADAATLIVAGQALAGMGRRADAEHYFTDAREAATPHERDEIDLLAGTNRAAMGDLAGAREALTTVCTSRLGGVEPRVRLARVLAAAGEREAAARMRDEAWARYREAPRFQRRRERFWAWRARPSRPLAYAGLTVLLAVGLSRWVAPGALASAGAADRIAYRGQNIALAREYSDYEEYEDDPANLPADSARRVSELIRIAPMPRSYASLEEVSRTVFALKFPGYGLLAGGEEALPDGGTLSLWSVEMPQSGRSRILVFRGAKGGGYTLVDDFIEEDGKGIAKVRIEGDSFVYTNLPGEPKLRRPSATTPL